MPRSQLRQALRHLRLRRVCRVLQALDPPQPPVRVQVQVGGAVRGGQNAPQPVPGLPAEEVLRGGHEQGRGPARARAAQLDPAQADGAVHLEGFAAPPRHDANARHPDPAPRPPPCPSSPSSSRAPPSPSPAAGDGAGSVARAQPVPDAATVGTVRRSVSATAGPVRRGRRHAAVPSARRGRRDPGVGRPAALHERQLPQEPDPVHAAPDGGPAGAVRGVVARVLHPGRGPIPRANQLQPAADRVRVSEQQPGRNRHRERLSREGGRDLPGDSRPASGAARRPERVRLSARDRPVQERVRRGNEHLEREQRRFGRNDRVVCRLGQIDRRDCDGPGAGGKREGSARVLHQYLPARAVQPVPDAAPAAARPAQRVELYDRGAVLPAQHRTGPAAEAAARLLPTEVEGEGGTAPMYRRHPDRNGSSNICDCTNGISCPKAPNRCPPPWTINRTCWSVRVTSNIASLCKETAVGREQSFKCTAEYLLRCVSKKNIFM